MFDLEAEHPRSVDPIILDRRFRVWRYGLGHSQLLLGSHSSNTGPEAIYVLFVAVRAVKLRTSYHPLTLQMANVEERSRMLAFTEVPERHQDRMLCVTLPSEDLGFVVCSRATVYAAAGYERNAWFPEDARVLFSLHAGTADSSAGD